LNVLIERSQKFGLVPEAADTLISCSGYPIYNGSYDKRPPIGIYNLSLGEIWEAFEKVLNEIDSIQVNAPFRDESTYGSPFADALLDGQEKLLSAINRYFDDCITILRCFYPPSIGLDYRKSFKKQTHVVSFDNSIQWYRSHVAQISNHIKHHQGRLRAIFAFNDNFVIPGYFAEGVDALGVIGPYPEIHQRFRGYSTAFSFYRDLRFHLIGVYSVSNHLAFSIRQITGVSNALVVRTNQSDTKVLRILERISELPLRFFEDEVYKDIPTVKLVETIGEGRKLMLTYPDSNGILVAPNGKMKILPIYVGDGVSKTFSLPYFVG
jgi:hypothetical protein